MFTPSNRSRSPARAIAQGQEILYVTERCMLRLEPDGVTVVELAPGVDLKRDVLAWAEFRLRVAPGLRFSRRSKAWPSAFVDEVTTKGDGTARAEALAGEIANHGPRAVQIAKAMINAAEGEDRDAPIDGRAGALTAFTQDLAEGVAAFGEKRGPNSVGR